MVNYGNKDEQIDGQSDMFHDWSKKNKEVKKQTFKFFYAKSSPPEKKKI